MSPIHIPATLDPFLDKFYMYCRRFYIIEGMHPSESDQGANVKDELVKLGIGPWDGLWWI